uniref:Uncharacterized protein n=1 Tax=Cacopsylla melanoneura TaxID=428564 RepID=A0A8D8Y8N6_9HEMI
MLSGIASWLQNKRLLRILTKALNGVPTAMLHNTWSLLIVNQRNLLHVTTWANPLQSSIHQLSVERVACVSRGMFWIASPSSACCLPSVLVIMGVRATRMGLLLMNNAILALVSKVTGTVPRRNVLEYVQRGETLTSRHLTPGTLTSRELANMF